MFLVSEAGRVGDVNLSCGLLETWDRSAFVPSLGEWIAAGACDLS